MKFHRYGIDLLTAAAAAAALYLFANRPIAVPSTLDPLTKCAMQDSSRGSSVQRPAFGVCVCVCKIWRIKLNSEKDHAELSSKINLLLNSRSLCALFRALVILWCT